MHKQMTLPRLATAMALLTLAACGGGGGGYGSGGSTQPPAPTYTVGGSISGLKTGGLALASGADKLRIAASATSFALPTALAAGASYEVRISSQPPRFTQRCALANVSNIALSCADHPALVSTLAGTDNPTKQPIGMPSVFNEPQALAVDDAGNVFVADRKNNRIAKVTPDGVVSTIAGNGARSNSDGAALQASFNNPYGVTVDKAGNVFIADTLNQLVRKLGTDGTVSTVAGHDNGVDAGDGQGTQASLKQPSGIVVDTDGNLYVAEMGGKVRSISPSGYVATIAGQYAAPGNVDGLGSVATFLTPHGIALDAAGKLYIGDQGAGRVRKLVEQ